jgi:hypothetical protein
MSDLLSWTSTLGKPTELVYVPNKPAGGLPASMLPIGHNTEFITLASCYTYECTSHHGDASCKFATCS